MSRTVGFQVLSKVLDTPAIRKTIMKLSEQSMQSLETNIPKLARDAFEKAYLDALTQSGKVMRAVNGQLVETNAEGKDRVIRSIHSPIKVKMGVKLTRRV